VLRSSQRLWVEDSIAALVGQSRIIIHTTGKRSITTGQFR